MLKRNSVVSWLLRFRKGMQAGMIHPVKASAWERYLKRESLNLEWLWRFLTWEQQSGGCVSDGDTKELRDSTTRGRLHHELTWKLEKTVHTTLVMQGWKVKAWGRTHKSAQGFRKLWRMTTGLGSLHPEGLLNEAGTTRLGCSGSSRMLEMPEPWAAFPGEWKVWDVGIPR